MIAAAVAAALVCASPTAEELGWSGEGAPTIARGACFFRLTGKGGYEELVFRSGETALFSAFHRGGPAWKVGCGRGGRFEIAGVPVLVGEEGATVDPAWASKLVPGSKEPEERCAVVLGLITSAPVEAADRCALLQAERAIAAKDAVKAAAVASRVNIASSAPGLEGWAHALLPGLERLNYQAPVFYDRPRQVAKLAAAPVLPPADAPTLFWRRAQLCVRFGAAMRCASPPAFAFGPEEKYASPYAGAPAVSLAPDSELIARNPDGSTLKMEHLEGAGWGVAGLDDFEFARGPGSLVATGDSYFAGPMRLRMLTDISVFWPFTAVHPPGALACATTPLVSPDLQRAACADEKHAVWVFELAAPKD